MQEITRDKIKYSIKSNRESIKKRSPKSAWAQNPDLRNSLQKGNKLEIGALLTLLQKYNSELIPFVKKIKSRIKDITETTHVCAIYLLLCHISDNWDSLFILAERGKHSAVGNTLRMIKEATDMVQLFAFEFLSGDSVDIDKWFKGEIVDQGTCRKKVRAYLDKHSPYPQINESKLGAHIYQMESQVSHNAYASILESVSPFTEDFDFDGYIGFYRTLAWLRYAKVSITMTNIALKVVYSIIMKDKKDIATINEILTKYNPEINDGVDERALKNLLKEGFTT